MSDTPGTNQTLCAKKQNKLYITVKKRMNAGMNSVKPGSRDKQKRKSLIKSI